MLDGTLQSAFEDWRGRARHFLNAGIAPERTEWSAKASAAFFAGAKPAAVASQTTASVPRGFLELAQDVVQHGSDERFALLYRLLWRLTHGARNLLEVPSDPLVRRLTAMAKAVREETAAIQASLRFQTVVHEAGEWDIAWHEPEHHVLESIAASFARSRGRRCWSILTPVRSAHWARGKLTMAPGAPMAAGASAEGLEQYWRRHYADLFAERKAGHGVAEWSPLPEATLIKPLIRSSEAHARRALDAALRESLATPRRAAAAPGELSALREDVARCRACPLYQTATQAVIGEGPPDARIMLVGEQPGDQEDLQGRPFVGPAGQILDRALAEAGIARSQVYVTNAVKHFKFDAARQAPHSSEAGAARDRRVPVMAGARDRTGEAQDGRGAGRLGRARTARPDRSRGCQPRSALLAQIEHSRRCDDPSVLRPAPAGSGTGRRGIRASRRGSQGRGCARRRDDAGGSATDAVRGGVGVRRRGRRRGSRRPRRRRSSDCLARPPAARAARLAGVAGLRSRPA